MSVPSWLRTWPKRLNRSGDRTPIRTRRTSVRPRLEALEDRAVPATFTVLNTNDSGAGSLRQAILDANANPGMDTIAFNIPGGGVQTIQPLSALPNITDPVLIDGFTQPGSSPNTLATGDNAVFGIELDGGLAGANTNGLWIASGQCTVRGLVVNRFGGSGVVLGVGDGNTVAGNFLGTDTTGTAARPNRNGLVVYSANNTIGGTSAAARNVVSGNWQNGVTVSDTGASGNVIQGNYIGTDATGLSALGNSNGAALGDGGIGVYLLAGAHGNTIGGTATTARNVISSNAADDIRLTGAGTDHNLIQGNIIGLGVDGARDFGQNYYGGDAFYGIRLQDHASFNTIGGGTAGARNVISGHQFANVASYDGTTGNVIAGNYVGVRADGEAGPFAQGVGVDLAGGACANRVGTDGDGINDVGERNVIAGNGTHQLHIGGSGTNNNWVAGNDFNLNAAGTVQILPPNPQGTIRIDGGAQSNVIGVKGTAANSDERNRILVDSHSGVEIADAGTQFNIIAGNEIGRGGAGPGVVISNAASQNVIGTDGDGNGDAQEGNVIDSDVNEASGAVMIRGSGTNQNVVAGNTIGLDPTGAPIYTLCFGVLIDGGAQNNRVGTNADGTSDALERNVIASEGRGGVRLAGAGTSFNVVAGNFIGTDAAGMAAVGNFNLSLGGGDNVGIVAGASNNTVGGTDLAARNVIAGDAGGPGVRITGGSANVVLGNFIGTDRTGQAPLGNRVGVLVEGGGTANVIGGAAAGAGNVVAFNALFGVGVGDAGATGNVIRGNSIRDNNGPGILLASGGNNGQPAPVLTTGSTSPAGTTVSGTLASPAGTYTLELFANDTADAGGFWEGKAFLGSATVTVGSDGQFTAPGLAPVPAGQNHLTATITDAAGNTSMFSAAFTLVTTQPTTTGLTVSDISSLAGQSVTFTASVTGTGGGSGTPTGTVQFLVDGANFGNPVALVGGGASLATAALSVGPHVIAAVYGGDGNFTGSTSSPTTVSVVAPSSVQGLVWVDFNDDGQVDFGEKAIAGVTVTLTGTDDLGHAVSQTAQTDADGIYSFPNLRPSGAAGYTVTETQPAGFLEGKDSLGLVNGTLTGSAAVQDVFSGVVLPAGGSVCENYNFGERPTTTGAVGTGQTATIGFWQNKNGQALILALNGGSSATQLGHWLAVTFPNLYASLDGTTNAGVAAFYKALFARTAKTAPGGPPKVDAQVLATALAVYVTDQALAGTAAAAYGFQVTATGVGTRTFNVGADGAAFGVANNSAVAVLDLLLAVDAHSHNGLLYDQNGDGQIDSTEASYRTMVNDVFSAINEAGSF
jgi:titin